MRILYAVSEVFPFAKTGGLADVAGGLPTAIAHLGHDIKVVMPKYAVVNDRRWHLKPLLKVSVNLAGENFPFSVWKGHLPNSPVEVLFFSNESLFNRCGLYQKGGKDYSDNLIRFAAFSRAVLEVPKCLDWQPEVIHGSEWQTALLFAYLRAHFTEDPFYAKAGTVFTVHNLAYQGIFAYEEFAKLSLPSEYFSLDTLEFNGKVNLLKAGLIFSGILNTVSPTYIREIQTKSEYSCGLEGVLKMRRQDLFGIVNGVDYQVWDPRHDRHIPRTYHSKNLKGKRQCKEMLQKELKLPVLNVPLLGMVARLTAQKGVDVILEVLDELMRLDLQLAILGTGDPDFHRDLKEAADRYSEKLSVYLTYDERLAHMIEAGSDLFLMPSRYEPCGLNQLYSLRYGTIPIVRKTGGLADTVTDALPSRIESGEATGFVFNGNSGHELLTTVRLALQLYKNRSLWKRLMLAAMAEDFSWNRSALMYENLYERAILKARQG